MQMSTQQNKKIKKRRQITSYYYYENNFDLTDQRSVDQTLRNAVLEHTLFSYSENKSTGIGDPLALMPLLYAPCHVYRYSK